VVLINVFEVPADKMAGTESTWKKSRDFLAQQPGDLNTRLHKNIDDKGRYQLINVAEWATANEFRAASTLAAGGGDGDGDVLRIQCGGHQGGLGAVVGFAGLGVDAFGAPA